MRVKIAMYRTGLESLGYIGYQSLYEPVLLKTDAPVKIVYDIMRYWKNKNTPPLLLKKSSRIVYKNVIQNIVPDNRDKLSAIDSLFSFDRIKNLPCYVPLQYVNSGPIPRPKMHVPSLNKL